MPAPMQPQPPMPQQPAAAPQPPQAGPAQGQPAPGGDMETFSEATRVASNLVYDENVFNGLVETASSGGAVEGLATTVVLVIGKVEEIVGPLSLDHLFALGMVLIVDVADALMQGGVEVNEQQVNEALQSAIQMYLQQNQGRFSKEELEAGVMGLQEAQGQADALAQQFGVGQQGAPAEEQGGFLSGGMA